LKRALISCYDKAHLTDFGRALERRDVEIYASGGTADHLRKSGVGVHLLEDLTGIGSLLGGRLKTLHPAVHAGLLARDTEEDAATLEALGTFPFDLLVVSLYPFEEGLRKGLDDEAQIELIDVGGPSMIRGAAKNARRVTVVVDPADYPRALAILDGEGDSAAERRRLAAKAFAALSAYDGAIATYLEGEEAALRLSLPFQRRLRYGENPHQAARAYGPLPGGGSEILPALLMEGKELSMNNLTDAHAALWAVHDLPRPSAVIVKHGTPCGAGSGRSLSEAYEKALATDRPAAFGGIAAVNATLDRDTARVAAEVFLEVLIAPGATPEAVQILEAKRSLRLIVVPEPHVTPARRILSAGGSLLVDEPDLTLESPVTWRLVVGGGLGDPQDLAFAWALAKHVKSNAVVVVKDGGAIGIGGGQVSRVASARSALHTAGRRAAGAVLASDGFIPFPDVMEEAARAGIAAVVEPGGSKGDPHVIQRAGELGLSLYFTGVRHFRH